MRRHRLVAVGILSLATMATSAEAGGPVRSFFGSIVRDFRRNNAWPVPFVDPDRDAVCAPFAVMVQNGWRTQNTLTEYHFREGSNELNQAGRMKVRWIATQVPTQFRTIFVERGEDPEQTAERIATVQNLAAQFATDGQVAQVTETGIEFQGWPADFADTIERKWKDTTPDPRLPAMESTGFDAGGS